MKGESRTPKMMRSIALRHGRTHHRHDLSRRNLILKSAGAIGLLAGSRMLPSCGGEIRPVERALATAQENLQQTGTGTPVPVPADPGFDGLHIYSVGMGSEPSSVGDFHGLVGAGVVDGTGVGGSGGGQEEGLPFDTHMRLMQGTLPGTDRERHPRTLAIV